MTTTNNDEFASTAVMRKIGGPSPPQDNDDEFRRIRSMNLADTSSSSSSASSSSSRTLVIIIGNLRGGEVTWQSMYHHLLDPNDADLALVISQVPTENRTSSLYNRAKYLYEFPEYTDWSQALDLIDSTLSSSSSTSTSWRTTILPYIRPTTQWSTFLGPAQQFGGSGAIHFMARYFVQELIRKEHLLKHYDRFVITRSDHYYLCHHDLNLLLPPISLPSSSSSSSLRQLQEEHHDDVNHKKNQSKSATTSKQQTYYNIWVPTEEDYGGICDRHVVCHANDVMDVLDIFPFYFQSPLLLQYTKQGLLSNTSPEEFLQLIWHSNNGLLNRVKRFHRMMFTVKRTSDGTRGRSADENSTTAIDIVVTTGKQGSDGSGGSTIDSAVISRKSSQMFWKSQSLRRRDQQNQQEYHDNDEITNIHGLRIKYSQEYYASTCTCRGVPLRNHRTSLIIVDDRWCFAETKWNRWFLIPSSKSTTTNKLL